MADPKSSPSLVSRKERNAQREREAQQEVPVVAASVSVNGQGEEPEKKKKRYRRARPDYQQEFVHTQLTLSGKTRWLLDEYSRDTAAHMSEIVDAAVLHYLASMGVDVSKELPPGL